MTDYPDLESLKAANETLRELGLEWLKQSISKIAEDINARDFPGTPEGPVLVGSQDWSYELEGNVMKGERIGVRYRYSTMLFEIGWPRLPEDGIVPDLGLARARVTYSPNVTIDPIQVTEFTLWRARAEDVPKWKVTGNPDSEISHDLLEGLIRRVLED